MKDSMVLYKPGSTSICAEVSDNPLVSTYGTPLEQLREEYPAVVLIPLSKALELMKAQAEKEFVTDAVVISEEDFDYALNVLPPRNWVRKAGEQSFKCSEMTYGHYTQIYARIGDKHYSFSDSMFLTHDEILEKCLKGVRK